MEHSEYKPGDFVVGKYNEMGSPIKPGKIHGDPEEIADLQMMIMEHGGRTGGRPLPAPSVTVKKDTKKSKKKTQRYAVDAEPTKPLAESYNDYHPPVGAREQLLLANTVEEPAFQQTAPRVIKRKIAFHNQLGKIKMQVEDVLESDMAFCIVFTHEDDVIFTPKPGETLKMTDLNGVDHNVYFADSLFTWTDHTKQLMILFKTDGDAE